MTPMALEVALAVDRELKERADEADALRHQQVERARYEADLSRRRYLHVDPANRLVADSIEAEWNANLRQLADAEEDYDAWRRREKNTIDEKKRSEILALATDFPRLWKREETSAKERKRMVRLIIEDVTLDKGEKIEMHVRFKGGAERSLSVDLPGVVRKTPPDLIAEVDLLLDKHTEAEIAEILNDRDILSGDGKRFDAPKVRHIRCVYKLASRYDRLREQGLLSLTEMSDVLDICTATVKKWHKLGLLRGTPFNGKIECLYEKPSPDLISQETGNNMECRRINSTFLLDRQHEVQYET